MNGWIYNATSELNVDSHGFAYYAFNISQTRQGCLIPLLITNI